MKFKKVMRYDPGAKMLRIGRIMWVKEPVGAGGYSAKLSLALRPRLFQFTRGYHEFELTVLGVRLHYQRAYGGRHV